VGQNGGSAIRVFVAAASAPRMAEIERFIRANQRLRLVGSAASATTLAPRIRALRPDVVLLDLAEPQSSFFVLASDFENSGASVVVLVDEPAPDWTRRALRSGVRGVLPRDASAADIYTALEAAHRGLLLLDPELAQDLFASKTHARSEENAPELLEELTPREIEVLRMMAEGLGNKEIAARLTISDHTVKFHISSILAKFGAATRTEAVTIGIRRGLVLL